MIITPQKAAEGVRNDAKCNGSKELRDGQVLRWAKDALLNSLIRGADWNIKANARRRLGRAFTRRDLPLA
jgi:hypothetical protein